MERKSYRIAILLLAVALLGGCGWSFTGFEYTSTIEAEPSVASVESTPIIDAEGNEVPDEYTTPIGNVLTGNPVADVFVQMMSNSGAIDAAKTISVCIVGDPASIGAFRIDNRLFKKITVRKGVFVIKTKDSK